MAWKQLGWQTALYWCQQGCLVPSLPRFCIILGFIEVAAGIPLPEGHLWAPLVVRLDWKCCKRFYPWSIWFSIDFLAAVGSWNASLGQAPIFFHHGVCRLRIFSLARCWSFCFAIAPEVTRLPSSAATVGDTVGLPWLGVPCCVCGRQQRLMKSQLGGLCGVNMFACTFLWFDCFHCPADLRWMSFRRQDRGQKFIRWNGPLASNVEAVLEMRWQFGSRYAFWISTTLGSFFALISKVS